MKSLFVKKIFIWILFLGYTSLAVIAQHDFPSKNGTTERVEVPSGTRKQRSPLGNIARLLFGGTYVSVQIGNMIPDHPLVRYPAPIQATARNMDNVIAAVPGMNLRRKTESSFSPSSSSFSHPFASGSTSSFLHPLGPGSRASQSYSELQDMHSRHRSSSSSPFSSSSWSGSPYTHSPWTESMSANYIYDESRPYEIRSSGSPYSGPFYPQSVQAPGIPRSYPQVSLPSQNHGPVWASPPHRVTEMTHQDSWKPGPPSAPPSDQTRHEKFGPPYYPYDSDSVSPASDRSFSPTSAPAPAPTSYGRYEERESFGSGRSASDNLNYAPSYQRTEESAVTSSHDYPDRPMEKDDYPPSRQVVLPDLEYKSPPPIYSYTTAAPSVRSHKSKSRSKNPASSYRYSSTSGSGYSDYPKSKSHHKSLKSESRRVKPILEYYPKEYDARRYDPYSRGHKVSKSYIGDIYSPSESQKSYSHSISSTSSYSKKNKDLNQPPNRRHYTTDYTRAPSTTDKYSRSRSYKNYKYKPKSSRVTSSSSTSSHTKKMYKSSPSSYSSSIGTGSGRSLGSGRSYNDFRYENKIRRFDQDSTLNEFSERRLERTRAREEPKSRYSSSPYSPRT